jgi:ech hydrogenase subunit D
VVENLKDIPKEELLKEVQKYQENKARLVTTVCNDLGDKLEATYYFNESPAMTMSAVRIVVDKDEVVPSISKIYLAAVLNENEMKEMFGMKLNDIAIDFGGHMLLAQDSPVTPMLKKSDEPVEKKGSE